MLLSYYLGFVMKLHGYFFMVDNRVNLPKKKLHA